MTREDFQTEERCHERSSFSTVIEGESFDHRSKRNGDAYIFEANQSESFIGENNET